MKPISFARHCLPAPIIQHAVRLYLRFTLSLRDIEDLLAERGVDDEGEVLDLLVQRRRNKAAALKPMHKLLKKQQTAPERLTTDKLGSYAAAAP